MNKTNFLKILNTPLDEVIAAIRLLRGYCEQSNIGKPFDRLEFLELFYLVHTKYLEDKKMPIELVRYLDDYADKWEEEIIDEIQEQGSYNEQSINDIWVAKQLILLAEYYLGNLSVNGAYWAYLIVDMFEVFPELDDISVLECEIQAT